MCDFQCHLLLTYKYIAKNELFEDLLRATREEIDECVVLLEAALVAERARHSNFNSLRGGMFVAADFVVWLFSFSAVYRNLSVMATMLGVHVGQVRRKVYWAAMVLAAALKARHVQFKEYDKMAREAKESPFGRNSELQHFHGVPVFIVDGTGVPIYRPSNSARTGHFIAGSSASTKFGAKLWWMSLDMQCTSVRPGRVT